MKCWICYEKIVSISHPNKFCQCDRGSQKYVHLKCIQNWSALQAECIFCKTAYNIPPVVKTKKKYKYIYELVAHSTIILFWIILFVNLYSNKGQNINKDENSSLIINEKHSCEAVFLKVESSTGLRRDCPDLLAIVHSFTEESMPHLVQSLLHLLQKTSDPNPSISASESQTEMMLRIFLCVDLPEFKREVLQRNINLKFIGDFEEGDIYCFKKQSNNNLQDHQD